MRQRPGSYIPHRFPGIVLTDRDDGTLWFVSYTLSIPHDDGYGYITITDTIPDLRKVAYRTYAAYDEPYVTNTDRMRLIVRGGYLGMEEVDNSGSGLSYATHNTIAAKSGSPRNMRIIRGPTQDQAFNPSFDMLVWEPVIGVGL